MDIITTTSDLAAFCKRAALHDFITVDTEFLRENTYFAQLCLVQIAYPKQGGEDENATNAVIDVLADGIDLTPLIALMNNDNIIKVFHAARQDIEIFYHNYGVLPTPFFDTQIAAMVAGYGEQVSYETLVKSICRANVDKTSRFTDWSKRPLSADQIIYARGDVTYLRDVYQNLRDELMNADRMSWVEEELARLIDPVLYDIAPREQWRRIKSRTQAPRFLAIVREIAAFREEYAVAKNIPRTRVFKDDLILELAAQKPNSVDKLLQLRLWPKDQRKGPLVDGVLDAIKTAIALKPEQCPKIVLEDSESKPSESISDLLRVLLKSNADRNKVASRLICSAKELDDFASNPDGEHALTKGWRHEIFGRQAQLLIKGEIALRPSGKFIEVVDMRKKESIGKAL